MAPPNSRPDSGLVIDPALSALVSTPPSNRDSSTQSAEPVREEKADVREMNLILQKLEEQDNKLSKMSESIDDWKIQNGRLLVAFMRSSQEALTQEDTSSVLETLMGDFECMVNAAYEARSGNDELEILRAENESMKAKLQTIALAMGSGIGDTTPAPQPLTSPMTAASTPSVLGKRKRVDVRSRHSLLQNEVSFTDEDGLDNQNGLYAISNATNMSSAPARHPEMPSTPLLSRAPVSQQYGRKPTTATISGAQPTVAPAGTGQMVAETSTQILTPPHSSYAEQHGRESRSTEPDLSLGMEPECSGDPASEAIGSIREANGDPDLAQNASGPEILEGQVVGTTTVEGAANDRHDMSSRTSRLQRACKPTPKITAATNMDESGYVTMAAQKRQMSRCLTTEDGTAELHTRETRASAADASRRKTTSTLPGETDAEEEGHVFNKEKEERRRTMNSLPDRVDGISRDQSESDTLMRQHRMTRAAASEAEYIQETGNANGYAEAHEEISEELLEDNPGQDTSIMTIAEDEEHEELFQRHQNDQHETQPNSNNKENERLSSNATSADGAQTKQQYRRNRDPSKPKRIRRKPGEIERKYKCLFPGCTKAYGELPHLNTHITDSGHGERWAKVDYLEASKKQGDAGDDAMGLDDSIDFDFDRLAEERNAKDALAALTKDEEKIKQRDRMAKEAMEREEMMERISEV